MSKRKRKTQSRATATSQKKVRKRTPSLAIPITVAAVLLLLVAGIIAINEQQSDQAGNGNSVATSPALATQEIPFPDVTRISLQETTAKLDAGQAVLIDVRSKDSYDSSHAVGALSFPEEEIVARLSELPSDKEWILY